MNTNTGNEIESAVSAELVLPPDASLALVADQLVAQAQSDGVALTGEGGLLTGLIQRVLQGALEAEITDHLGEVDTERPNHALQRPPGRRSPITMTIPVTQTNPLSPITEWMNPRPSTVANRGCWTLALSFGLVASALR